MIKCQDEAVAALGGEWNEASASLAVASYLIRGGVLEATEEEGNKPVLFSELYGLDEADPLAATEAKLTTKQRSTLPGGVFCGPNRSFPVPDKVHAVQALRLLGRYKGPGDKEQIKQCILRKAAKFGVGGKESAELTYFPIEITVGTDENSKSHYPIEIKSLEDAKEAQDNLETICSIYGLEDGVKAEISKFIVEIVENAEFFFGTEAEIPLLENDKEFTSPINLGSEFLLEYFVRHESKNDSNALLAQLVGLARKEGIGLEKMETAGKAYSMFGSSVLRKLLVSAPAQQTTEQHDEEPQTEQVPVVPILDPVVNTTETSVAEETVTQPEEPWYKEAYTRKSKTAVTKQEIKKEKVNNV